MRTLIPIMALWVFCLFIWFCGCATPKEEPPLPPGSIGPTYPMKRVIPDGQGGYIVTGER